MLKVDPATVSFWRRRFALERLDGGLCDAPRPGRRDPLSERVSERVLHATRNVPPPRGPRWSTRSLARFLGVNHMQVYRTWKSHGVRPGEMTEGGPSSRPAPPEPQRQEP